MLCWRLYTFKEVNDTFGHNVGDALLQTIAVRLMAAVQGDVTLSRTGGDEFALLVSRTDDILNARIAAESILVAFRDPFIVCERTLQVGVSIGIAVAPFHARDAGELLLRSDLAQLAAKRAGGRQWKIFDSGMEKQLAAHRLFKDELRTATERGEWELFYQPQIRLDDGALIGAEALLRWRHPVRGLLLPAAFLPVLETHLVAYEVGNWVIGEACRQLAEWRMMGIDLPRVSVNLFAAQFSADTIEHVVSTILERYSLCPADLELEITETIALRKDDQILKSLTSLRKAGVHIAFDDFGTGFASLTTIKQVPVSRLKIDRIFVQDICADEHSAAIVSAIVSIGNTLGLEVIAEGIESIDQKDRLIELGCLNGQGYLYGKPASAYEGIGAMHCAEGSLA